MKRSSALQPLVFLAGSALVAVCLYVLSFGPLAILEARGRVSAEAVVCIYYPLLLASEKNDTFGTWLYQYCVWLGIEEVESPN
jgi:hypothetical protein